MKKPWYTILPFAAFLVVIPFLIERIRKGYIYFSAGEVLGYYGAILGAAATIIAFITTIRFTLKNQKYERKLSIKPQFQTENI